MVKTTTQMPQVHSSKGFDKANLVSKIVQYEVDNMFFANSGIGLAVGFISLLLQNQKDMVDYAPLLAAFPYIQALLVETGGISYVGIAIRFVEEVF